MKTKILHLSDIHAGPGELIDEDSKLKLPDAERQMSLSRLTDYLSAMMEKPDYVVVSGDITIQGNEEGHSKFADWLNASIQSNILPGAENIIVVPGNHDVRRMRRAEQDERNRFSSFWTYFGKKYVHSHIPGHDPKPNVEAFRRKLQKTKVLGGVANKLQHGEAILTSSLPFLLDREKSLLIYAFNSAHACGVHLPPDKRIVDPLQVFLGLDHLSNEHAQLGGVLEAYLESLLIDAGMLRDEQIRVFAAYMNAIRSEIGDEFEALTKIATLHHHVGHLWRQQLELKVFEATIDAADFKQSLIEFGFDFVLHGHKHTNHVGIDASIVPIASEIDYNPLITVSGGTVGGYPRLNDRQTFKIIDLDDTAIPRRKAIIYEIPLVATANPQNVIRRQSKKYPVELFSNIKNVHVFSDVKEYFDDDIFRKICTEVDSDDYEVSRNPILRPRQTKAFAPELRYKCFALLSNDECDIYVEVILLTKEIGFSTFSRLRWFVSEILPKSTVKKRRKALILLGDLSATTFADVALPGELDASMKQLEGFLKPSVDAGLLEIRRHVYEPKEATDVASQSLSR